MPESQLSQQNKQLSSQQFEDQNALDNLRQEVGLNNHQLLQLTYNDQKFYHKLKELNRNGCISIRNQQYTEALIYLNQAEKVLEYAASCGKTIERKFIITTLNNEACLYQKAWELEKAESYLEAIIYNISSFFYNNPDNQQDKSTFNFTKNVLTQSSNQHQDFCISLWRKKSLVSFYLQYTAVNSQSKNHQNAFKTASKAVALMKQICMNYHNYQKFHHENTQQPQAQQTEQNDCQSQNLLLQLASLKPLALKDQSISQFYFRTVRYIAIYINRLQSSQSQQKYSPQLMQEYKKNLQTYTIGNLMQISPVELDQQEDKVYVKREFSLVEKHLKAMSMSVGHFILGTEGRYIASEKYTLDEDTRKNSPEYLQAQLYHMCAIIIATKYLQCQSAYFDHIVNSFRNHYKIDILEDAKKYIQENPNIMDYKTQNNLDNDSLFHLQNQEKNSKQKPIKLKGHQIEDIDEQQSQIKTVNEIPGVKNGQEEFRIDNDREDEMDYQEPISPKQNAYSGRTKSTKQSKNTINSQSTATKKTHKKKPSSNALTKSQARLQTHESNNILTTSHHQTIANSKNIKLLTSRQKQNKQKLNPLLLNSHNVVKSISRSKKKSDYQFIQSQKKIQIVIGTLGTKKDKNQSKQQTIYHKKQSDYVNTISQGGSGKNRSKSKRVPTSNQTERKMMKRKDSYADLRKTKKVQDEYGIAADGKTKRQCKQDKRQSQNNQLNLQIKKSKQRKQSEQKLLKLSSAEPKLKKLKSPVKIALK